jgi:RNA-binding protein
MFRNSKNKDNKENARTVKTAPKPASQRTLKKRSLYLDPVLQVGKKGITDAMVIEINKQFKLRKLLKIKILKAAIAEKDKKEVVKDIADKTGSKLVSMTGFIATFYKEDENVPLRR